MVADGSGVSDKGAMHISHQQEEFSRAFVHAVASCAGFRVQPGALPDDDSIDLTLCGRGPSGQVRSPKLDVQLKCLLGPSPTADFAYPLKVKNYNDLCPPLAECSAPRILVVVVAPTAPGDWAVQTAEALLLRHRAFWACLHGAPPSMNAATVSVPIRLTSGFTPSALVEIMARVGRREQP